MDDSEIDVEIDEEEEEAYGQLEEGEETFEESLEPYLEGEETPTDLEKMLDEKKYQYQVYYQEVKKE